MTPTIAVAAISAMTTARSVHFTAGANSDISMISALDRHRNTKDAIVVDQHADFLEACRRHELVHFGLRATAHDPRFTIAIGQDTGDHLLLRMPRLVGIKQQAAGLDRSRQATQRFADRRVAGKE